MNIFFLLLCGGAGMEQVESISSPKVCDPKGEEI